MSMDFNVEPYYDDFDETKQFYKTLFRPGYAVQTRELNQIQTNMQHQLNGVGKHMFKEGSVVVPGNVIYDNAMPYAKLELQNSSFNQVDGLLKSLEKTIIVGQTSGATALVIHNEQSSLTDPPTIYFRYLTSGSTSTHFVDGETFLNENGVEVKAISSNAVGMGTVAGISDGVYYINGYFVNVFFTFVTISKYANNTSALNLQPTAKIGIVWEEIIVTSVDDESLLDNAQGTPNYSAPGADRYKINTSFQVVDFENPPLNFVELISIDAGVAKISQNQPQYNEISKELARRTYEESGDYVVDDFRIILREHRKNFTSAWVANTAYLIGDIIQSEIGGVLYTYECIDSGTSGSIIPTFTNTYTHLVDGGVIWVYTEKFFLNDGFFVNGDDSKYIIEVTGGVALVKGYEYSSKGLVRLVNDKAREYNRVNNADIMVYDGTYITVKNLYSIPSTIGTDFVSVDLYSQSVTTPGVLTPTQSGSFFVGHSYIVSALGSTTQVQWSQIAGTSALLTVTNFIGAGTTTVTCTVDSTTGFAFGDTIVIAGATGTEQTKLNGTWTIASVPTSTTFTFVVSTSVTAGTLTTSLGTTNRYPLTIVGSTFVASIVGSATTGTATPAKIGTATVRWIEHDSASTNFRAYLYDIAMSSGYTFERHVKQLYYNNASGLDFTCDVVPVVTKITGTISGSTTITGVGTLFSTELIPGDYITINNTTFSRVISIASNSSLVLSASIGATGSIAYLVTSEVFNNSSNSALVGIGRSNLRKIKSTDDSSIDTQYTITRALGLITSNGSGRVDMALSAASEGFASTANATNYLFINNTTGASQTPTTYTVNSSTSIYANGLTASTVYTVYASVIKTAAHRTKVLNTLSLDFTTLATATALTISLGKADCYRIVSIYQAPAFGTITTGNLATVESSKLFSFDSGQRSLYYGLGSISRVNTQVNITGSIRVVFEYFTHSSGEYFSVDSYENVIPYNNIDRKLRDTLDFRPVKNDSGIGFNNATTGILKSGFNISADYSYYIPRIDALVATTDNNISIIKGISSAIPKPPGIPANSLPLYYIGNPAYGSDPKRTVLLSKVDNKRFTMRDIGKLEKRISTLELYTSLSMVEAQTANVTITDGLGNDTYKNGFIVEPFNDHGVGDVSDIDYSCFINSSVSQLYPQVNVISTPLSEVNTNNTQRIAQQYVINDGLITLPYTEVLYSKNIYASRVENVNPFSIATFNGSLSLYPSSDTWFDTVTLPTITQTR